MNNRNHVTVTINISREIHEQIIHMMGPLNEQEDKDKQEENIIHEFTAIGFNNLYNWLAGKKRYKTISEQNIAWLGEIYNKLLPKGEAPSYSRIFNKFNVPYGQARYIIRVITERELPKLLAEARKELKKKLNKISSNVDQALKGKKKKPDQLFKVVLTSMAHSELIQIVSDLYKIDDDTLLPGKTTSVGDLKTVMVPAKTIREVLDLLNQK